MNRILNMLEKKVVIFGIGTNAKVLSQLYKQNEIEVLAYVIGNDQEVLIPEYEGIPIYKLSMCDEDIKQLPVVVSVRECSLKKVLDELVQCSFNNIISANNYKEWVEVLESFYQSYFKSRNINIDTPVININGSQFINGFQLDIEGKYSYLVELGDIILPSYFSDFSICNEGPYELEEFGIGVKKGDVVFDCGANMGLFSGSAINRGGVVYGFEPTPKTRAYLKRYEEMYPEYMHILPYALSNEEGITNFYVGSDLNGENSISNLSGTGKECITVPMSTVDSFVKQNGITKVDFIKADIEGAERYMLMGAVEVMKKFSPQISICTYHMKDDPEVLEDIIMQANPNYKIVHKYKKLYAYI